MIGKETGNYRILKELGKGGMGVVYKANQISLGRMVAMKVLPQHLTTNPSFIKRFKNEARAIAKLNHPNIVQIFDVGQDDGTHYYTMEFIEGPPLDEIIYRDGRLPLDRAINIILQVAGALQYAHGQGIVHRDIKPSNIMIDKSGRIKVTDFGLALQQKTTRLTIDGGIVGTPEYMSPEQAVGQTATAQSDIYSLGIVFYELLTGKVPFEADSPLMLLNKIRDSEPQWPCSINPDIPAGIEKVIRNLMAKKPQDRYQSCQELIQDIKRFKMGQPISAPAKRSTAFRLMTVGAAAVVLLVLITAGRDLIRDFIIDLFGCGGKRPPIYSFLELPTDPNFAEPVGLTNLTPPWPVHPPPPEPCEEKLLRIDKKLALLENRSQEIRPSDMWPDRLVLETRKTLLCDIQNEDLERVHIKRGSGGTAQISRDTVKLTLYATPEEKQRARILRAEKDDLKNTIHMIKEERAGIERECQDKQAAEPEDVVEEVFEPLENALISGAIENMVTSELPDEISNAENAVQNP
jgi:predicted Ser/Thr protein kinase